MDYDCCHLFRITTSSEKFMDKANEDRESIIISRKNNENAVLIAQDEYDNMRENLYLLSNQANYSRLMESKKQLE
ncbi:type II toxin-antitoxin system Phd/YefM family antitoxin [Listeria costaricensis]|uniref:type II toxin-antitoxin system Phd/YefM family antitoxin n=1 Tax=Listeria costaricensis TaxID=2026604 RepID=UPI003B848B19